MQAFSSYMKILKKNVGGVIIYVVIFMLITAIFSSMGKDPVKSSFTMEKLYIAVIDRDNSELSKGLKSYMKSIHNVVDMEDDVETLQDNLYYRNVSYILIIPEGYGEKLARNNLDHLTENVKVPDSFEGTFVDQQINQYIKTVSSYLVAGYEPAKALSSTSLSLAEETRVDIINEETNEDQSNTDPMYFFFQYLGYVFICIIIIGLGPILLTFNNPDIKRRIDVSSQSLKTKSRQLILFSCFFSVAIWLIFMILAAAMHGTRVFSTAGLLMMANSFVYILVSLSITYVISLLVSKPSVLSIASNIIGLGMSFLCGIFVPQSIMSEQVLNVSRILPGYWYMDAHNTLMSYNGSASQIKTICADYGIMFGFAVAFLAIGMVISKLKQENA